MALKKLMLAAAAATLLCMLLLAWSDGTKSGMSHAAEAKPVQEGRIQLAAHHGSPLVAGRQPRRSLGPTDASYLDHYGRDSESLLVKFKDHVEARVDNGRLISRRNVDVQSARQVAAQFRLTPSPYFAMPEDQLRQITERAAIRSAKEQPDLAGIIRFRGPHGQVQAAAHAMQALDLVEYVDFEEAYEPAEYPHLQQIADRGLQMRDQQRGPRLAQPDERVPHAWERERVEGRQIERVKRIAEARDVGLAIDQPPRRTPQPSFGSRTVHVNIDSGVVRDLRAADDPDQSLHVTWSEVVGEPGAPWIRLFFGDVALGEAVLVIRSLKDGSEQVLDADELAKWRNASAYFNGDRVLVQLRTRPPAPGGIGEHRVHISRIRAGEWVGGVPLQGGVADVCGGIDERELSCCPGLGGCAVGPDGEDCIENINSCAVARLVDDDLPPNPVCTGFLFDDNSNCMISAGHCVGPFTTAQFNVPCSLADGTAQHPAAQHQYPVALSSVIFNFDGCDANFCVNDWAYFRVEDSMGLSPLERQGFSLPLAASAPPAQGQMVQVLGYGTTEVTPAPLEKNTVLQQHEGPLVATFGTTLQFQVDVTSGNSGGPIIDLDTGLAIGILTCGGCGVFGGANIGTAIHHPGLSHALFNEDCREESDYAALGACCIAGECPGGFCCFDNVTVDVCDASNGTFMGLNTTCHPLWGCAGVNIPEQLVCCAGGECVHTDHEFECRALCGTVIGQFIEDVFECPEDDSDEGPCDAEPGCGVPAAGPCFEPNTTPFCSSPGTLCPFVCSIDPFCCDDTIEWPGRGAGHWDERCALHARLWGGVPGPICASSFGSCFEPGLPPGCNDPGCCHAVCSMDPECCNYPFGWDGLCAQHAQEICVNLDPLASTPDLSPAQGYLTPGGYLATHGHVPSTIATGIFLELFDTPFLPHQYLANGYIPQPGWGGEGFNLEGLWELGEFLLTQYGLGHDPIAPGENLTRGKTIQIGVLAPTAFVHPTDDEKTHEALRGKVAYAEPDQTQLFLPVSQTGLLNGHMGTAVLGIIGANGVGMKGVSPDADLLYFPTVSVEQGGRFQNALASALSMLGPGDVVVVPYTPRPGTPAGATFASQPIAWQMFNIATDLGISPVIAAGDACDTMAAQCAFCGQGPSDSGAILVGAVTPGAPFYRHGMSRYCPSDTACVNAESVHTAAWGLAVAAPGFGDMYFGLPGPGEGEFTRTYTNSFTGTAPATAMIGGVVANLIGLTKQFYSTQLDWEGAPLTPLQVRGEVCGNGFLQAGLVVPPGSDDNIAPCYGDWDLDQTAKRVGSITWPDPTTGLPITAINVMVDTLLAAEWLLIAGFFDDPPEPEIECPEGYEIEDVFTIRGTEMLGGLERVCLLDGVVYLARSEGTTASSSPSFVPPGLAGPLNQVNYRSTGQIADVLAVGMVEDPTTVTGYGVVAATLTTVSSIQYIELYDWLAGRWQWGAVAPTLIPFTPNVMFTPEFATLNPQRFFNSDGLFLIRIWAFGFGEVPGAGGGFGTGAGGAFDFAVDLIDVQITTLGDTPSG